MRRLILPLLIALPTGWFGSLVGGETLPPPRRALDSLTTPADALSGDLEALGATLARTERSEGPLPTTHPLPLAPGRCTSVVALAATAYPIRLRAVDASGAELLRSSDGFVAGLSLCDVVPSLGPVSLLVEPGEELARREPSERDLGGVVELRWFEGGDFDASSLPLGTTMDGLRTRATPTSAYHHHVARVGATEGALLPPTDVAASLDIEGVSAGAWLLPRSEATTRLLQLAASLGSSDTELHPHVHPASLATRAVVPEVPSDVEPLWHGPSGYQRVLAVVDPGDLPVGGAEIPCAELTFVALAPRGSSLARVESLTDEATPLARDRDAFCPGDPPRLYVVPPADRSVYRLVLRAVEGGGPRRAAPSPPAPGEHAVLRRARAECEADAAHCATLARHLRFGTYGPPDSVGATTAYERACEQSPSACLEAVGHLDVVDGRRALTLLETLCPPDAPARDAAACAVLGDRHRLGAGATYDLARARAAYERGCEAGHGTACSNRNAMDLLEL